MDITYTPQYHPPDRNEPVEVVHKGQLVGLETEPIGGNEAVLHEAIGRAEAGLGALRARAAPIALGDCSYQRLLRQIVRSERKDMSDHRAVILAEQIVSSPPAFSPSHTNTNGWMGATSVLMATYFHSARGQCPPGRWRRAACTVRW
jgi:hypothetical protein